MPGSHLPNLHSAQAAKTSVNNVLSNLSNNAVITTHLLGKKHTHTLAHTEANAFATIIVGRKLQREKDLTLTWKREAVNNQATQAKAERCLISLPST